MSTLTTAAAITVGLVLGGCATPVVVEVGDGTYRALVPTTSQLATNAARDLPGGFAPLRDAGMDDVEAVVDGDVVTVRVTGSLMVLPVTDRLVVRDREGSGPFRAAKEVLVLGDGPLVVGGLVVDDPVVWPGGFDGSPVITIKPRDPDERGPAVTCSADEPCLLLSSGAGPAGGYEDANDPARGENPVTRIEVTADSVVLTLDDDRETTIGRGRESSTIACGLAATALWDVPARLGLDMEDPVLVHTRCPSNPGDDYLTIMERSDVPVLAPLGADQGGEWCRPGPRCLLFVPVD